MALDRDSSQEIVPQVEPIHREGCNPDSQLTLEGKEAEGRHTNSHSFEDRIRISEILGRCAVNVQACIVANYNLSALYDVVSRILVFMVLISLKVQ